jgi:dTDP-4-amino-4,6-dideoxygalactose transaminase
MITLINEEQLAVCGGAPVRRTPWPNWPQADENTESILKEVLNSGRWAISGPYLDRESFERKFAREFAEFNGAKYCTPVMNGTSSLVSGLLALGVGFSDEVLVPGLTWVACASTVLSVGAIPVIVDIDPETLCMSLDAAKKAITPKTKAIMIVHAFGALADLDGFLELSKQTGIPIIEDCSQAHGAKWLDQRVGTFGKVGCFSMQQSKLLTSGEGGAIITNDADLYRKIEQVRSDGRLFTEHPKSGELELVEEGQIQGYNMCLSEFQAAVLSDRLSHLDSENEIRHMNARILTELLHDIEGVSTLKFYPQVTTFVYYNFVIRLDLNKFGGKGIDAIAKAMSAELATLVRPIYRPMNKHTLYTPLLCSRVPNTSEVRQLLDPNRFNLPHAEEARKVCLTIPHWVLLDGEEGMKDIAKALKKLKNSSESIPETGSLAAS